MNHAERQEMIWNIHRGAENIGSRAVNLIRSAKSEVAIISGKNILTRPLQERSQPLTRI